MAITAVTAAIATLAMAGNASAQTQPPGYPPPQPSYPPQPGYPAQPPPGPPPPGYPQPPPQGQYPPAPVPPPPTPDEPSEPPPPAPEDMPTAGYGLTPTGPRDYSLPPEPDPTLDRRGFVMQVGIGLGGVFATDDSRFGVGYNLAAGGIVGKGVAVLFDYSALTYGIGDDHRATHTVFGGLFQLFLGRMAWLKLGAGLGQLSLNSDYGFSLNATERALAGIAAVGIEVYQLQPDFAIDLQVKGAGGHYTEAGWIVNGALVLGLNWY